MKYFLFCMAFVGMRVAIGGDSVISMATGIDGVREIVASQVKQDELDLSPEQLADLKGLLARDQIITEYRRRFQQALVGGSTFDEAKLDATKAADELVKPELRNILRPGQLAARRRNYLRARFGSPAQIFQKDFLAELRLEPSELESVTDAIGPKMKIMFDELDKLRSQAVATCTAATPQDCRSKYANLFGPSLFPGRSASAEVDPKQIAILPESRPGRQLGQAVSMILPKEMEYSAAQYAALTDLTKKQLTRAAKERGTNHERMIDTELDEILRPAQRVAIIQHLHRQLLHSDLNTIIRPEIAQYVGLTDELVLTMRTVLAESQVTLKEFQTSKEREIFRVGVDALPKEIAKELDALFDGVWGK